ncbi:MAG: MFS transporter, partial [Mycobacteriaceae bacterium]|nr:MFS transporter [Mycobacteriaceae bacterium]
MIPRRRPAVPAQAPRSVRRPWVGLAVLTLPAWLASLELTVTHLALPTIGTQLGASSTQQLWIVDIYAFMLAGSMLAMGSVGDRIGRRRLLLTGSAVFAAASSAAAYAPNAETLIVLRAVMGVAGSTLMPSILALTAALFPDRARRRVAVGAVIASVSGGTAAGPLIGGWLLEHFWWGAVFLIGVPVMALLLLLGPWLLPETAGGAGARIDVVSAFLTIGGLLPVVYALKRLGAGEAGGAELLLVLLGLILGVAFVRRQRRLDVPMVDPTLFRNPVFAVLLATLMLGIFVLWG